LKLYNSEVHLLDWIYEEDYRVVGNEQKMFTIIIEQYLEIKDNWGCKELEPMKTMNESSLKTNNIKKVSYGDIYIFLNSLMLRHH
jgi:hypothetical protein